MEVNANWKTTAVSDDLISTMQQIRLERSVLGASDRLLKFVLPRKDPFLAFNNTALAVQLGLLEVVKFLIEDKGVDPNEYGWTLSSGYCVHLVSAAMSSGQKDIFHYLLSLPSTNLYSEIDNNDARDWTHGLFEQALDIYVGHKKEKAYLTSFVNHNRFDVNRSCHRYSTFPSSYLPTRNFPCLFIAVERVENCLGGFEEDYSQFGNEDPDLSVGDSECLDRLIDVMRLLLEAGANPNQDVLEDVALSRVYSSIGLVEMWLHDLHPNEGYPSIRLLRERVYKQVLAMMREAQAP